MGSDELNVKKEKTLDLKLYRVNRMKKIPENIHIYIINILIAVFGAIFITRFILGNLDYALSLFVGVIIGLFNAYRITSIKKKKNISK